MKSILLNLGIIYLALFFLVHLLARTMIFIPPPPSYKDNQNILKLTTKDNATIAAIYLPNPNAKYTLLVSHGNAEDLGRILPFLHLLQTHGYAVFAYDYNGYGLSGGRPSEKNSYQAIDAAYAYLINTLHIPAKNIIPYGRSLGAAMALDLAVRQPVAGVIMESGFVSAFRVATHIPLFPLDKFTNLHKITKLKVPVLIIHGVNDHIVPFWHGKKLFKAAPEPKHFFMVNNAGHNDVLKIAGEQYWQNLATFIQSL